MVNGLLDPFPQLHLVRNILSGIVCTGDMPCLVYWPTLFVYAESLVAQLSVCFDTSCLPLNLLHHLGGPFHPTINLAKSHPSKLGTLTTFDLFKPDQPSQVVPLSLPAVLLYRACGRQSFLPACVLPHQPFLSRAPLLTKQHTQQHDAADYVASCRLWLCPWHCDRW